MLADGMTPDVIQGEGTLQCVFESLPLLPKVYEIWGSVQGEEGIGEIIDWQLFGAFRVQEGLSSLMPAGTAKAPLTYLRTEAPCHVPYKWIFK